MVAARVCRRLFGYTGRLAAELAGAKNFDVVLSGRNKDALAGLGDRRPNVAAVKEGEEIKDERATNHEQWIVKVRMRDNGRSPRRSSAMGEIARERSSQGHVSSGQIYRNGLGR